MRKILLLSLIYSTIACSNQLTPDSSKNLQGVWVPIKQEMGGKILPAESFISQKLIIENSIYIYSAESLDKGIVKYKGGKMDIYGKEGVNAGKHFTAIYKLENKHLTICYNLKGDSYPITFETKSNPLLFLSEFKKLKQQKNGKK